MKLLRLFALLVMLSVCSAQTEIAIDSLRLELPAGYEHKPAKGIDSTPGSIVTKEGSVIRYDLGIGAGAHGKITHTNGDIVRYAKRRQPNDYLGAGPGQHVASQRQLSSAECVGEFAMNALRLRAGFHIDTFTAHSGLAPDQLDEPIGRLCEKGLLVREGNQIRTTPTGYRFLDTVVGEFF